MRVVQLSHGIYPISQAGTEIYTAELAGALLGQGVDLVVVIPAARRMAEAAGSAYPGFCRPVELAPATWCGNKLRYATFRGPLWRARLRQLLREVGPDVVHVHHAIGFGLSALDVVFESGVPLVITLPDFWLLCPGILGRCQGSLTRCAAQCCSQERLLRWLGPASVPFLVARRCRVRRFVERARPRLVAISNATRCRFEREGFPSDLLTTHEWGIDVSRLRRKVESGQQSVHVPRIAYIGTMRSHKGCHILADSFKRLKLPASLHFYGGGDERYIENLRGLCRGMRVEFHGRFDHAQVGDVLANVDIVVIPSLWDETYCLVAQEAMAARKPIVASNVGGMGDRIIHGVNGFLVRPGDPADLANVLTSLVPQLPDVSARLDYDRCLLSIDDDARWWISLYQEMIAQNSRPSRSATSVRQHFP